MNHEVTRVGHSRYVESLTGREIDKKTQARTVVHQHLSSVAVPVTAPVEGTIVFNDAVEVTVADVATRVCGFHGPAGCTVGFPNLNTTAGIS